MVWEAMGSKGSVIQLLWFVVGLIGQVVGEAVRGCCLEVPISCVCPETSRNEGFPNRVTASSGNVVCLDILFFTFQRKSATLEVKP